VPGPDKLSNHLLLHLKSLALFSLFKLPGIGKFFRSGCSKVNINADSTIAGHCNHIVCLKGFLLLACFCALPAYGQDVWQVNRASDQSCEWLAPGRMRDGMKRIPTVLGEIPQITWVYQPEKEHPNYLYMVSWIDYPVGTFSTDSIQLIQELFSETVSSLVEDIKGELVYGSVQEDAARPAYIFRAALHDGNHVVKGRMMLDKDRFYMMQVYTFKDKSLNNDIDRFLQSLRIF
jgi:hypothetical protein